MSFPSYPRYKSSGIEWLGKVPEEWEKIPLRLVASGEGTLFIDGDWIETKDISETGIRYLTSGNVGLGSYKEQGHGYITDETFATLSCTEVLPGDILISRLNLPLGRACIVPPLGARIVTCVDNVIVRPSQKFSRQFLVYLLSSKAHFENTENLGRGATMQRLSRSTLGRIQFALPSLPEQRQIAAFLDFETARIDELIAEQQQLMELLREKRQAVISHAVTRGLDPTVPMKDSGVPWLGEIPAHWFTGKLGRVCKLKGGFAFAATSFGASGVPVVRMNNLKRGYLDLSEAARIPETLCNESVSLQDGDLVWGMSGSTGETGSLGNFARVRTADLPAQLNQRVGRFVANPSSVDLTFLEHVIQTQYFYEQVMLLVTGTAQYNVSSEQVESATVAIPPLNEQTLINSFLHTALVKFDMLVIQAEAAVDLLQERRAALISAAVTGQIDVRGWVPPETA
jgi:type I restriction enzyme S subunit